jgi:hypothetical protein
MTLALERQLTEKRKEHEHLLHLFDNTDPIPEYIDVIIHRIIIVEDELSTIRKQVNELYIAN